MSIADHYCGQIQPHAAHGWTPPTTYGSTAIATVHQCAGVSGSACGDSPGHGVEGQPPFRCELPLGHGGRHVGGRGTWS